MKIPIIGESCMERWKKEVIGDVQQTSLAHATKIAKEEIDRICQDRYKQQKLKTISKDCCSIPSDFRDLDIGKKIILRRSIKTKPKRNTNLFGKRRRRENFPQENTSKNPLKNHLRKILLVRTEIKNVGVGSATVTSQKLQ